MRLIRVMCSGRVDMEFVFRAFSKGADGVFIGACHLNECNYITHGNYQALSMVSICRKVMENIGLDPQRLRLTFMSGSEANVFVEGVNDFVKTVKDLGPLGSSEGIDKEALKFKIDAVQTLIPYLRLVERERLRVPVNSEEEYLNFFGSDEVKKVFDETVVDKLEMAQIVLLLRKGSLSTAEMAAALGMSPSRVSRRLRSALQQRMVRYDDGGKCFALA